MVDADGSSDKVSRIVSGTLPFTRSSGFEVAFPDDSARRVGAPWIVALHGFGESGSRLRERLSDLVAAGFVLLCPDGPYPVEMRSESPPRIGFAWYQYTGDGAAFAAALTETGEFLDRLIATVGTSHGLDPNHVVLLGYSQGGYLAGVHALSHPDRFVGLVAIATRVKSELFSSERLSRVRFPVLAIHGERDPSTSLERQRDSIDVLARAGIDATLLTHGGGHGLRRESVFAVREFLERIVARS